MDEAGASVDRIPRDRLWRLPVGTGPDGSPRPIGVEIEFAGLSERNAAAVVETLWGGTITNDAPHAIAVAQTRLGTIKIELDTAWKDKSDTWLADRLLDLSREVVPVEIVMPPLPEDDLPEIERLILELNAAGALGTEDGVLLAFGIHFNPQVAGETQECIAPVVQSYAFLERWLRASDPPSLARRILPFIDPWPRAFVDECAGAGRDWQLDDLCDSYLDLVRSRNHGLDLLPLLEHLCPDRVRAALPEDQVKGGRPTWHYRLPETRLDPECRSFAYEWNRWVLVERVAGEPALLSELTAAWGAHRSTPVALWSDWVSDVQNLLEGADLWGD